MGWGSGNLGNHIQYVLFSKNQLGKVTLGSIFLAGGNTQNVE